jgi:hypothetical protein
MRTWQISTNWSDPNYRTYFVPYEYEYEYEYE